MQPLPGTHDSVWVLVAVYCPTKKPYPFACLRTKNRTLLGMSRAGRVGQIAPIVLPHQSKLKRSPCCPAPPPLPVPWKQRFFGHRYAHRLLYMLLVISQNVFAAECGPWGRDADLCYIERMPCKPISRNPLQQIAERLIGFHQEVISPADGPRSHFFPTSSHYTMDAIHKYGFFRGWIMGCDRLMRENNDPWIYRTTPGRYNCETKYDPVP